MPKNSVFGRLLKAKKICLLTPRRIELEKMDWA
jgi:hypothetical protein